MENKRRIWVVREEKGNKATREMETTEGFWMHSVLRWYFNGFMIVVFNYDILLVCVFALSSEKMNSLLSFDNIPIDSYYFLPLISPHSSLPHTSFDWRFLIFSILWFYILSCFFLTHQPSLWVYSNFSGGSAL